MSAGASAEQAFNVFEMTVHQLGCAGAVALGERLNQRLVIGFRTGAHAARSAEADDEGGLRDEFLEKLGQHAIARRLGEAKMKRARETDRFAALASRFRGAARAH